MKRLYKPFLCICFSFVVALTSGCGCKTLDEFLPDMSEYGEWDGNYIYRGNVRAKTTGEDEELCLPEVTYNENIYLLDKLNDQGEFYYLNDNEVLFLARTQLKTNETTNEESDSLQENQDSINTAPVKKEDYNSTSENSNEISIEIGEEGSAEDSSNNKNENHSPHPPNTLPMLIKYFIKEKTYDIIYAFEDMNLNYDVLSFATQDFAIICQSIKYGHNAYVVDLNEKSIRVFSGHSEVIILKDCIVIGDYKTYYNGFNGEQCIYYVPYSDFKIRKLLSFDSNTTNLNLSAENCVIDDTTLVKLQIRQNFNGKDNFNNIYYLNTQTEKFSHCEVLSKTDHQYSFITDEVFVSGIERKSTTLKQGEISFINTCKLYRLSYKSDELICNLVYTFPEKLTFLFGYIFENAILGVRFTTGRREFEGFNKCYVYDLANNTVNKMSSYKFSYLNSPTVNETIICGNWEYFIASIQGDGFYGQFVYMLKGKNSTTGEERLFQAFAYKYDRVIGYYENDKYAENIFNNESITKFSNLDGFVYIKILPY
ncbi:MAG: hypothetical protein E7339_04275 [Clostridiales bacterium]|nr:hypothetical protein [Clostridiales bacterium]